jgi:hypothetical protein
MRELWEEPDCEISKDKPQRLDHKEEANRKTPKSGKKPGNTYSVKGSEGIWGRSDLAYEEEDKENWSGQYG